MRMCTHGEGPIAVNFLLFLFTTDSPSLDESSQFCERDAPTFS